jgi:uroporphyrin-III C-methyltransferase / precorrin-2 dehydrogenase / sirohydrochlorin ferrochelatase
MTGHSRHGDLPETIQWDAVADPHRTTILYMGARMASKIRDNLLAHGMVPEMPVIAMASISRANEARWLGTIATLPEGVKTLPEGAPILIGIGRVFGDVSAERLAMPAHSQSG